MKSPEDTRTSRDQETRDAGAREQVWIPPNVLPDPHPRPGLVYRWVRTSTMGQADPINVSTSFREGWSPVLGADYPELQILSDYGTRWPDGVEVGGLLLCSAPAALSRQRQEHYRKMTEAQMQSVNDQLEADTDPRFRTMFRSHVTQVTRGFGPVVRRESKESR
jgi:hypothetical protein